MKQEENLFKIQEDLPLIREFFNLSQEGFAEAAGVERITIARVETKKSYPRNEFMNKVYDFSFRKGLRLNEQKELFYRDDIANNHLLLTHASKEAIQGRIDLIHSKSTNDFGKGFYCGESYEKSVPFVCRFPNPSLYFLDFNPSGLKCKKFEVDTNWMLTIAYFRGLLNERLQQKKAKVFMESIKDVDYIVAPIADNRMFQIIDTFINGEITDEQCKHCLAATNLGMQYVFLSERSLNNIQILERCFLCEKEKEFYQSEQTEYRKIGNDKSKLARIQYRGKGKYIDEL